ncbi:sugar ABC transporter permease [Microlunatus endophyticus]|uniref:Sugar ABC transporter permease n=1 Tax=Microlunatus endophyticus TaxID=1716077 RepID=A0A917S0Q5_9ACTN|nr:sugar ABC transporter permease [Microlunatus endophyticus]GGL47303.1 sugar ABC transporter permease [Microlunatus endophyticus]
MSETVQTRFRFRPLRSPVAYLFVLPAMAIFAVFTIIPTVYAFGVSTFKWNYLNSALSTFVGLDNYKAMIQGTYEPSFASTMGVSLYFVASMVVLGTILSLLLAVLLYRASTVLLAVRSALFLTYVTPLVATSLVWVWMFNPRFGLANAVVNLVGIHPVDWLNNTHTAMPSIIIYSLWHEIGFTTIVFVGGLTTISTELSEAARIDGAGPAREFLYVTLPQLRPFVIFVVVIGSVSSLHAFTQFFVLTGGGPGYDTSTLGFQLYQQAFVLRNTGYAAALAVVLFLITILLSLAQLAASRSLRSSDH